MSAVPYSLSNILATCITSDLQQGNTLYLGALSYVFWLSFETKSIAIEIYTKMSYNEIYN